MDVPSGGLGEEECLCDCLEVEGPGGGLGEEGLVLVIAWPGVDGPGGGLGEKGRVFVIAGGRGSKKL